MEKKVFTREDFVRWGRRGGKKGRKHLTSLQARAMVAAREAKKQAANK